MSHSHSHSHSHSSTENSERTIFYMCHALWGVQTRWWQARSVSGKCSDMYVDECVILDCEGGPHVWRVSPSLSQLPKVSNIFCRRLTFETWSLKTSRERSGCAQPRTGVGVVRLHLKVPADLTDQTCEKKVEFLHEVERSLFCKSRTVSPVSARLPYYLR